MRKSIICIVITVCVTLPFQQIFAQSGVGIGTSNPNPNAALDIQSSANDKGILIPRLTSTERLAMNATLSVTENGLLVFDSDLKEFFYWNSTIWTAISVIQDLQLVGNSLSITKNSTATVIDLSPFSGSNTDNQDLSSSSSGNNRTIDISGGTSTTFNVADNDNNIGNELQTISKAGSTVTLSAGGGTFTDAVNDADNNASNELQTISKAGATVTLSNGGGSFVDDDTDADADPANEIQTISKAGSTVTLSNGGGTFADAVNDADANASNELQTISKAGATVTLSNGGGSFVDDDTDADADPANEIQTISKTGSTVTLSNGGGTFTDAVNDADASTVNEIQTLSLAGSVLSISSGNTVTLPASAPTSDAFKAWTNTNLSFASGWHSLVMTREDYDLNDTYDEASGVFKAPVAGIYHFSGSIKIALSNASVIYINVLGFKFGDDHTHYNKTLYPSSAVGDQDFNVDFSFDAILDVDSPVWVEIAVPSSAFNVRCCGEAATHFSGRLVVEL